MSAPGITNDAIRVIREAGEGGEGGRWTARAGDTGSMAVSHTDTYICTYTHTYG